MHKFRYLLVIALAFASSYVLKGLKVKVNADGVSFDWQVNPTVR